MGVCRRRKPGPRGWGLELGRWAPLAEEAEEWWRLGWLLGLGAAEEVLAWLPLP